MIYLGHTGVNKGEIFRSAETPRRNTHPGYQTVTGPFRTVRGAKFMLHRGHLNPHCQTVSDAERLGKKYADEMKSLPKVRN